MLKLRALISELRDVVVENGSGECFSYAYTQVRKKGGVLKHGIVEHPWDGKKFPHAWVERDGKVYDWQSIEVRKQEPLAIADFKKIWKPADVTSYDSDEAVLNAAKSKHYGPWS